MKDKKFAAAKVVYGVAICATATVVIVAGGRKEGVRKEDIIVYFVCFMLLAIATVVYIWFRSLHQNPANNEVAILEYANKDTARTYTLTVDEERFTALTKLAFTEILSVSTSVVNGPVHESDIIVCRNKEDRSQILTCVVVSVKQGLIALQKKPQIS